MTAEDTEQQPHNGNEKNEKYWRPLSSASYTEYISHEGETIRVDAQGRVLCHAKRRDGKLCMSPVVTAMKVCRMHGGSTNKAKQGAALRLAQLVNPAIATLAKEMTAAEKSGDRLRAADSVLDRAGHGRHQVVEASDAKELLRQGLYEMWRKGQQQQQTAEIDPEDDAPVLE